MPTFGRSMLEHWESGRADTTRTLNDPRWVDRPHQVSGVHVYDLASPSPSEKTATVDKAALREHHNRRKPVESER